MSFFDEVFDPNAVEDAPALPAMDREPLPDGDYLVQILEAEAKTTAKGGEMLSLKLEVLDGPRPGRWVRENINIVNANPDTEKRARADLATIMSAIGQGPTNDVSLLIGRPFKVTLKTNPGSGGYGPSNGVKRYHKGASDVPAGKTAPRPAPAPAPAAHRPAAPIQPRTFASKIPPQQTRSIANGDQPPF